MPRLLLAKPCYAVHIVLLPAVALDGPAANDQVVRERQSSVVQLRLGHLAPSLDLWGKILHDELQHEHSKHSQHIEPARAPEDNYQTDSVDEWHSDERWHELQHALNLEEVSTVR